VFVGTKTVNTFSYRNKKYKDEEEITYHKKKEIKLSFKEVNVF